MHELILVLGTAAVLFTTTLLRGFQNKSVAGNHKRMAFTGGTVMSALEMLVTLTMSIQAAKSENPYIMLLGAFGAGAGWVAGMLLHDRMMKKKLELARIEKKSRRAKRIQTAAHAEIIRVLEEHNLI
jgi:hypothetical protein